MGSALSKSKDVMIHVYTGDRPFAGTDANVKLIIFDEHGNSSNTLELDRKFKDDFERGQVDTFRIPAKILGHLDKTANLSHIELWRDESGVASDWCVDKIVIENRATNNCFTFPTFRWIKSNYRYRIKHLDTSLPQFDEFPENRKTALEEKRELYQYDQKFEGAPVQVSNL